MTGPHHTPPKEILLIGGGHAHVQVLRNLMIQPEPGIRATIIIDRPIAVYSGMIPGWIAGEYQRHELEIDIRPLARRAGARVIIGRASNIDSQRGRVDLEGRPPLPFDALSLDIGSTVMGLDTPGVKQYAVASRPIGTLMDRILCKELPEYPRIIVVGGGAAGVEVAFAIQARMYQEKRHPTVTLLQSGETILPEQPALRAHTLTAATRRGIEIRTHARVLEVGPNQVTLTTETLPADLVLWVTGAAAHEIAGDLARDTRGFIKVYSTLCAEGRGNIFAAGDCASFSAHPLPKAGVYAVRQGPVLTANLRAWAKNQPLQPYHPQHDFLALLNLGDKTAIGGKWGIAFEGSWVWQWKDRIDRKFMKMFQVLDTQGHPTAMFRAMPEMADMPCGGCAAKLGQAELHSVLSELPAPISDPSVVLGVDAGEDVAVVRHENQLLSWNIDAFTAFTDDPYLVGQVVARHALSDLEAKGGEGRWAMALVGLPTLERADTLTQVMAGMRKGLDLAGVSLVGGHTLRGGDALVVGLTVLGGGETIIGQSGLVPGDRLILTRPLGSGILLRGDMLGMARSSWMEALFSSMVRGNGGALRTMLGLGSIDGLHGMTDVTGFGLLGHLAGMLEKSKVSVRLFGVPCYEGVDTLVGQGILSTAHAQNQAIAARFEGELDPLLVDPQTGGGLLVGVAAAWAEALVAALVAAGEQAAVIGEILPASKSGKLGVLSPIPPARLGSLPRQ